MKPVIQIALDFVDIDRAIRVARESVRGGADWLEAGTPLIKSCGLDAVRTLRKEFPGKTIIADMKILDAGRTEVEIAAKSGADIVVVMANASDNTIQEAIEAARNYGAKILVDFMEDACTIERVKKIANFSPDFVGIHIPIDQQMTGNISFDFLKQVSRIVSIPIAIAGGLNSENVVDAIKAGASILIIGGAVTKSEDAEKAVKVIRRAIESRTSIKSELFKRYTDKNLDEVLSKVSTANLSDAMHRSGWIPQVRPVSYAGKFSGQAITVRTYPGDWAKPVEAVDIAQSGQVIVIDACGLAPAVWGELATHSASIKKIAGVVIHGAIRDIEDIRNLKFPAYASLICPQAGEPKGLGEINVPIQIGPVKILPGDWIVGDEDGVVCIPSQKVAEIANRAMDVLEKENRLRAEIKQGGTLSKITHLLRWEKPK
ncbi:MAG TPA: orotidine 5'-phosphate decarboxylase [bacterium]|nr:orotidine 5'-phosphate decarboxylase [bacterium]HPP08544.1 orotidine 5'-phosphate decarboxylase [bacterium]